MLNCPELAHTAELELNLMLAECKINFPGGGGGGWVGGWVGVAGLTRNKANSAQLGLAGARAELRNYPHLNYPYMSQ